MTDDVESLIKDGIRAYKANKKDEAFEALSKATELDPYNAQAWIWLSAVVESEDDKRVCLENVLHIDPDNAAAQKGLKVLNAKRPSAPPPAPEPPAPPKPSASSAPIATSSASAFYDDDISEDVYDDWAASLPIGNAPDAGPSVSPFTNAADFIDDEMDFDSAFSEPLDDAADLGEDPFGRSQAYDDEDEEDDIFGDSDLPSSSFASGPFGVETDDIDDIIATPTRGTRATDRPQTSPRSPVSKSASKSASAKSGGALLTDDLRASAHAVDEADAGEYFAMIPQEIKATRLPGAGGGVPLVPILGVLTLLAANVAVLFLLITRLAG
jgi:hypothetical protein